MAIKFETLNMPKSTCKQEISEEQNGLKNQIQIYEKSWKELIELTLKCGKNLAIEDRKKLFVKQNVPSFIDWYILQIFKIIYILVICIVFYFMKNMIYFSKLIDVCINR